MYCAARRCSSTTTSGFFQRRMTADYGDDPQLKLLLLSQRLTSLKRQRAYNLTDIVAETESPNNMDVDLGNEFGEDEKEDDDDNDFMWKPFRSNDTEDDVKLTNNKEDCFEGGKGGNHFDMNSLQRQSSGDVFTGEYVDIDEDFVAPRSINCDLHFHEVEGEDDDEEDAIDFKALAISKHSRIDKPEAECSQTGVGFSRIADYYRYPEFLHDVKKVKDVDVDIGNDDDCPTGIVGESGEEEAAAIKRDASSDERKRLPTKKSASNMKSARKLKSGLKQKLKQTLSGRLLEISDDVTSSSDAIARMDTLFHQCVCTFPWRCKYSTLAPPNSAVDVYLNEGGKKGSHGGSGTGPGNQLYGRDDLTGWSLAWSERGAQYGYGGGGRKVSSARDSNRRRKYDPFIHRNISDSSKYTFKHYQDWQAYVDEYRRYYTVGQTGMAMKSHPTPEGGGRREAVVIVRTLADSLVRPRLQECNIPDWDDFTDLSATPMRPLHLGPSYRSGKVPDLGVTWLAAATAHHHEVPAGYRHPANRHIKLTNIRHAESMGTQIKKRHRHALLESSSSTPRVGTILPHDAGVKIPMEPMHIVEDFRKGPRKERFGADMQPIGCRFLASWRPNESTRVKSAKVRSRKSRMDGKTSEGILADDSSSPRCQMFSKQGSLQPLVNGQGQTRAGLLKLFTPQKGLDVLHVPSGADVTGQVTDTNGMKFKSKASVAARSVDALKWTNLPTSADKSSSKSRADLLDKTASEKGSATRSGTLARRPTARLHNATQTPQKELLQVRGESKKNQPMEVESGDGEMPPPSSSPKEKDGGIFAKTRIKLVAPYAQPLAQDNVLIGSPYGTSPLFASEELSTTVQSTG